MSADAELGALSQRVGAVLQKAGLTLATAESCTGGWVSKTVTDMAGSSAWFACGFTVYSNKAKSKLLGVTDSTLEHHGAVSEETAFEMAEGALYRTDADVALSVTGIAGPAGGTAEKPVGTVCFAWYRRNEMVETATRHFVGDREQVRRQSAVFALEGLLNYLAQPTRAATHQDERKPITVKAESALSVLTTRATPFDLIDAGKAQLAELLAGLRIDWTAFDDKLVDTGSLDAEYRAAIAARIPSQREAFPQRVQAVGRLVQDACELDADAMIGCMHLDGDGLYTVLHPLHQAIFVELAAKYLGLPSAERLSIVAAALTANITILNLQEALQRQAVALTPPQQRLVRQHPSLAKEALSQLGVDDPIWLQAVSSHHERTDGNGYPTGAKGEEIPLSARLIAMADIYDAMIKPREHREPNQREVLRQLFLNRGEAIDANLTAIAVRELGVYPPGAFVKLKNGEIAVVIKRVSDNLRPIVRSLVGPRGAPLERAYRRNTEEPMFAIQDVVPRDRGITLNLRRIWDYDS